MTHPDHANPKADANDSLRQMLLQLDQWRHLPSYQLERRVDVLFGLLLPKILQGQGIVPVGSKVLVIPEFPLHKYRLNLSEREGNWSVNVDFAVFCESEDNRALMLVELKADDASMRDEQFRNMCKAKNAGAGEVLPGVIDAARTSAEARKYAQLIWKLLEFGCMYIDAKDGTTPTSRETYRQMCMNHEKPGLARHFRRLEVHDEWLNADMELVLIHPKKDPAKSVKECFRCIKFHDAADAIEGHQPPLGSLLAGYLRKWACQDAGHAHPWN